MIIRCTAKLLKEMGIAKADLVDKTSSESALNEWYAHLFFLARRKCILFAHAKTYYGFVAYGLKREDIRNLDEVFRKNLGYRLYEDGFSPEAIKKAIAAVDTIAYSRTIDRQVLGVMNHMIYEFGACLDRHGFVTPETLKEAADFLPRSAHKQDPNWHNYIIPLAEMWPLLEERYPVSKTQAREIAEKYSGQKIRRIFAVTGQLPERMQSRALPSEPCWYVFYQRADEPYNREGKTLCVSRATGAVLYDEG